MHCKYETLFLLLLPGKESDSLIQFVFGSTWNFPFSDDSDGLREEWFNCFNFHYTYVYASFKYFMSVLSVQKLFARLCYYILSCTETCQKYSVTVIFYYIFHIKPQFLKTLFQSQYLFDFDEIFTNRMSEARTYVIFCDYF